MASLTYNIRWIENTFDSHPTTETLLAPQRESGNITTNDYELATRFLPASHRHYRIIGGLAAIPVVYAFRKPGWSTPKSYIALSIATMAGFVLGHTFSVSQHYKFVRALEDPIGFSRALENIQRDLGGVVPQGPVIIRHCRSPDSDHDEHAAHESAEPSYSPVVPSPLPTANPTSPPLKSTSRWDHIRAENARTTSLSSWDAIRQKHEKTQLSKSGVSVRANSEERQERRHDDGATEQAQFDALLEKERHLSRGNTT
ncbi:hypothetical protein AX17_000576 [Amanita inopinata Kibby_2008]|nr:hypothetical protein AX17_000576 [Amanita inopinata Kibby_2008]